MKAPLSLLAGAVALVDFASAHYRFTNLIANGTNSAEYYYVRVNTNYNSPVVDVTSNDIRCNTGGLSSGTATNIGTVTAGSTVGFGLDQAIFHHGPFVAYLSKSTVANVQNYDGSGPWFKIAEQGATFSGGEMLWPEDNAVKYTFTIPAKTPPGQYLLRVEHIALHSATAAGGAQFYISCAHLNIKGSGGGTPSPTVLFPGAYKATDPGIMINIYWPIPTNYTVPGPQVWTG